VSGAGRWLAAGALAAAVIAAGCDDGGTDAPPSRVVGVKADDDAPDLEAFCDVYVKDGSEAKPLEMPPLEGEPADASAAWHWVNVWATWCQPCVEEMPMLVEWQRKLESDGASVKMTFLSIDDEAEKVAEFRKEHPGTPEGPRLADKDALEGWITGLGMDPGATIPLQVFADPEGRVRCVRSGAVNAPDYRTVEYLLDQP